MISVTMPIVGAGYFMYSNVASKVDVAKAVEKMKKVRKEVKEDTDRALQRMDQVVGQQLNSLSGFVMAHWGLLTLGTGILSLMLGVGVAPWVSKK